MRRRGSSGGVRGGLLTLIFALACILLGGLLLLQAFLLYSGSLALPDFLLTRLHEELDERGWKADYRSLRFYPPATLIVKDLQLTPQGEPQALLAVDVGRINLSLTQLLRGEVEVNEAAVYGGTLFCPARLSPTGVREQVIAKTHAAVAPNEEGWEIRNLNAKLQNISLSASGNLPRLPERREKAGELEVLLKKWLPQIIRDRAVFERAENPHVRLQFGPSPEGGLSIHAEAWADALAVPITAEFPSSLLPMESAAKMPPLPSDLSILQPHFGTRWSYDGAHWTAEAASLNVASVGWDAFTAASRISVVFHWPAREETEFFPAGANLALAELRTEAGVITDLGVSIARQGETQLSADFFALFRDEPLEGALEIDWHAGSGRAEILSRINPTPFLQSELARELGLKRDIWFGESPFVRAAATVEDWRLTRAGGRALTRQADIDGVFMHRAAARAELLPDRFIVPEMFLAYDDFEAKGSYEIHLASRAYRLLLNGSVRPLHISAWFRDWWVTLWEDFAFPKGPLQGDVDIHGVLGEPDEVEVVGSVGAEDFSVRRVSFDAMDAKLTVAGDHTDLFDINLARREGKAAGSFRYWKDPESSSFGALRFEAESNLDPTEVAAVFGDAGREFISSFRFTEPPNLSLRGTVFGPSRADETKILLTGEAAAPLEYHGLPLTRLKMTAEIDGTAWRLSELSAGLAGGEVSGRAKKWNEEDIERLGFTLFMRGLNLERALDAVARWQAAAGTEATRVRDLRGILDMYVDASGVHGDFESFVGEGSVRIREADLAEVHLLGILSRILSATPLGFTSLQFSEADASFRLDLNKVHFENLQLTGPTSAIRAAGDYFIGENALDASLRVYLLKESKIPFLSLLLSPLLEPLAHVLEIRLAGPAADPQWRFLLGPRNILKTISSGESGVGPEEKQDVSK